jgi:F-type H+-transporting ATPase subunit b
VYNRTGLRDLSVISAEAGMISVDGSLVIQIVNFVFLIWILNIVLYKPIRKILLQRKDKISGFEKNIQTSLRDAKEKDESLLAAIKAAREMGLKEKEALLNSAAEDEGKIIRAIQKKAEEELIKVRQQIEKDADSARVVLQEEIDNFAEAIGQKILGRSVS